MFSDLTNNLIMPCDIKGYGCENKKALLICISNERDIFLSIQNNAEHGHEMFIYLLSWSVYLFTAECECFIVAFIMWQLLYHLQNVFNPLHNEFLWGNTWIYLYFLVYFSIMTSSHGSFFRVTGPLCRESPVTGELPSQSASNADFDVSLMWVHISC